VRSGDVPAEELIIGGAIVEALTAPEEKSLSGANLQKGVRAACAAAQEKLSKPS
jgi:CRISPR-associated protein Cst2